MNNMTKVLFSCIFILLTSSSFGQFVITISGGYAGYKLDDLKQLNYEIRSTFPVEVRTVNDFPSRYYPEIKVGKRFKNITFGLGYSFHSTGSKLDYKDYSGEIYVKQITTMNSVGPFADISVNPSNKLKLKLSIGLYGAFTDLKLEEKIQVYNSQTADNYKFHANSFIIQPAIEISYPVLKCEVSIFLGSAIDTSGAYFYSEENSNIYLSGNNKAKTNWSGIRTGISFSYILNSNHN